MYESIPFYHVCGLCQAVAKKKLTSVDSMGVDDFMQKSNFF